MVASLSGLVALTLCLGVTTTITTTTTTTTTVFTPPPVYVYRDAHYDVAITSDVAYASTMVNCTDQSDPVTCVETSVYLDVYTPLDHGIPPSLFGQLPVVMGVHGGAYTGGKKTDEPPCDYWAARGFVCFAIDYRLARDHGLFPVSDSTWWPNVTVPHGTWLPPYDWVYCAVRDAKAALRWIHANAATYGGDPAASFTLQGGSAGATTVIELAITGGDDVFSGDYTNELVGVDPTLDSTNLDSPALVTGLIDYWGALFAEDAMVTLDDRHRQRWSSASPPTIAFHGTNDTTVSPESGDVLCGNLTAVGVGCLKVDLVGEGHGCWKANVTLDDGTTQSIYDYAFGWMAARCSWEVL